MKTPEQITADVIAENYADEQDPGSDVLDDLLSIRDLSGDDVRTLIVAAIEADRAQRHHWDGEIYIVQNDAGDVVDAFWDADEASAAYQYTASGSEYSIIQETAWEPGEYAEQRIRTLTEQWEETVNYGRNENEEPYRASDYALSEDDWRAGLDDEEAAEIARLIEWQEAQK